MCRTTLAAIVVLLLATGCGGPQQPANGGGGGGASPAPQNNPPANPGEAPAPSASPDAANEGTPQPTGEQIAPTPPVAVVIDAPPAPAPFSGTEKPDDTPVPPEVQRKLKAYDGDYVGDLIELLQTYPQAEVRRQAADRLGYMSEEENVPRAILALRGALRDPNPKVQMEAANELANYEAKAKDAVGELIPLIRNKDEDVSGAAIHTLAIIGPDAAPAIPHLLPLLDQEDFPNRGRVVVALGSIGPAAKAATAKLVALLSEYDYREDALWALARFGAEEEVFNALKDNSLRYSAIKAAAALERPTPRIVQALIEICTSNSDSFDRANAAESLGVVRPSTKEIADALMKAAEDENETVRQDAVKSLGKMDPKFDEAIPVLIERTKDKQGWVRDAATVALGKYEGAADIRLNLVLDAIVAEGQIGWSSNATALEESAKEFYPLLEPMAKDPKLDEVRRAAVVMSLAKLVVNSKELNTDEQKAKLVDLLKTILDDETTPATVRAAAALQLHWLDEEHPALNAALLAGLKSGKFPQVRIDCASALKWKNVDEAIPLLITALGDPDDNLVVAAISALNGFRERATDAVEPLVKLAQRPKFEHLTSVAAALGEIGTHPELSRPALEKMMDHEDAYTASTAAEAAASVIVKNDLDATSTLSKIADQLKKEDSWRTSLMRALMTLGPKAAPLVPKLLPYLDDKSEDLRENTADALGAIGPEAKAAAPALVKAAGTWKDPEPAIEALGKIKAGGKEFAAIAPKLLDNLEYRNETLEALAGLGPDAAGAIPAVLAVLDSPNEYERRSAAVALGGMGKAAASTLPKLKQVALDDDEEYVRSAAAAALLKIAPDDPQVLETSLGKVEDMDDEEIAEMLKQFGDRAPQVVAGALKSESATLRRSALRLLPKVLEDRQRLISVYERSLADQDPQVRREAALALERLGHSSPELLKALVGTLGGERDWEVQSALRNAGRAVVPLLAAVVLDDDAEDQQRRAAIGSLSSFRGRARSSVETLRQQGLASENAATRQWAAIALAHVAPESLDDAPLLVAIAGEAENPRRADALRALQMLRFENNLLPDTVAAALLAAVKDSDEEVAGAAKDAVTYRRLGESQLPAVLALLNDDATRGRAVGMLEDGTIVSEQLLPPLLEALKSSDENLRRQAAYALRGQKAPGAAALIGFVCDESAPMQSRIEAAKVLAQVKPPAAEDQQRLAKLLASENTSLRQAVAVALADWKYDWSAVKPHLLAALKNDRNARYEAVAALQSHGPDAELAAELVAMANEGDDDDLKSIIYSALGVIGKGSPEAAAALIDAIRAADEEYRRNSLGYSLSGLGDAGHTALLAAAGKAKGAELARLLHVMRSGEWKNGDAEKAAALLRTALTSDDVAVREQAALSLPHVDPKAGDAVKTLLTMLDEGDDNRNRRDQAVSALGQLGPQAKAAVPALAKLLEGENSRYNLFHALQQIGPDAAPAVPQLIKLLDGEESSQAASTLAAIGPPAVSAAPALMAQLKNESRMRSAAFALQKIGAPPAEVLPVIYEQLRDPYLRYGAVAALGAFGDASAVPVLARSLEIEDPELQQAGLNALGDLGEKAAPATDAVLGLLAGDNDDLRSSAAFALGHIKSNPEKVVPALIKALSDPKPRVKRSAASALGSFGEQSAPAVAALTAALADRDAAYSAAGALGAIGPAAKSAVPELVRLAKEGNKPSSDDDGYDSARYAAIRALGELGPAASEAVPALVELHADQDLRRSVAAALWKIDPAAAKQAGAEPPRDEDEE